MDMQIIEIPEIISYNNGSCTEMNHMYNKCNKLIIHNI